MLPRRYKLIRLHFESLGPSHDAAACEDINVVALLEAEDGNTVERTEKFLAYPQIMSDPAQFPSLIADVIRSIMTEASLHSRAGAFWSDRE